MLKRLDSSISLIEEQGAYNGKARSSPNINIIEDIQPIQPVINPKRALNYA